MSGTPLAAKIGFAAIEKIIEHGEKLERARLVADQKSFLQSLRDQVNALQHQHVKEGGNQQINQVVSELDDEFLRLGKNAGEDSWKEGDRAVFGPQADFLKNLTNTASNYVASVPTQADFLSRFLEQYVNASNKMRNRDALRSPFARSKYQDGYVSASLTLDYDVSAGYFAPAPGAAKLHCPKSEEVAEAIVRSRPNFSLDELGVDILLEIQLTERARKLMPPALQDRSREVRLSGHMVTNGGSAKEHWEWVKAQLRTSTSEVLSRFTKLEG